MNNSIGLHLFSGIALFLIAFYSFQRLNSSKYCAFSLLPLLLALEQFCLSLVLITVQFPAQFYLKDFFLLFFLIVSQVIWPIWYPFALRRMERTSHIKRMLTFFVYIGIMAALIGTWDIIFNNVNVILISDRFYLVQSAVGYFQKLGIYFWIAATFLPAFISYTPRMWFFALIMISAGIYLLFLNHNDFIIFTPLGALVIALTLYNVVLGIKKDDTSWSD